MRDLSTQMRRERERSSKIITQSYLVSCENPTDPDEMSEAASLLNTLEESVAAALELDLTPKELAHSLSTFHNGKAPGPDGFSPDFWKHFWDDLHEPLLDACNESFNSMRVHMLLGLVRVVSGVSAQLAVES